MVLILLMFRYSKPGVIYVNFECDDQTKNAFESALKWIAAEYKENSSNKATLIVYDDHLTYHGQIFRFYWSETLEKKIMDVVSSHIKAGDNLRSERRRFEQVITVSLSDEPEVVYTVKPQANSFDEIAYKIISDVLKSEEKIFENGYLVLSLWIEMNGKKLMFYDSRTDQFYIVSESGGN